MSEQNKPIHNETNQSRRQLLKNIGLTVAAGAGAVAAGTTTVAQAAADKPEEKNESKTTGYRETQHVRDYYETL
ncbi:formate dehydrogenase subunit or accessory protein [Photobacterium chitinilyticum]|uniref:formate dehydrogenase subunit or accessory protein n=1 Tax=Photobacterium chitinilyticum TaxID=2485123 RepID=UPI003D098AA0